MLQVSFRQLLIIQNKPPNEANSKSVNLAITGKWISHEINSNLHIIKKLMDKYFLPGNLKWTTEMLWKFK